MAELAVGDQVIETTPSGQRREYEVINVDAEPKYDHGYDGRWIQLRGERRWHIMRECDVLNADWLEVVPQADERNAG